jgi:hypothetical protein
LTNSHYNNNFVGTHAIISNSALDGYTIVVVLQNISSNGMSIIDDYADKLTFFSLSLLEAGSICAICFCITYRF